MQKKQFLEPVIVGPRAVAESVVLEADKPNGEEAEGKQNPAEEAPAVEGVSTAVAGHGGGGGWDRSAG